MSADRRVAVGELLAAADSLVRRSDRPVTGSWSRAAALLIRQALECSMDALWQGRVAAMQRLSMRAQLICLPEFLRDDDLSGRVNVAWNTLSNACHAHPYELAPTLVEVRSWLETAREFARRVEDLDGGGRERVDEENGGL